MADKISQALKMIEEAPVVVYDTETSGLDWTRNFPVGHVVAAKGCSVYLPVRHAGGGNLPVDGGFPVPREAEAEEYPAHPVERALSDAFKRRAQSKRLVVGHHLKFDMHMAANVGIDLGHDHACTMVTEALLDEYAASYSLEAVARKYGVTAKKGAAMYAHVSRTLGVPEAASAMAHFWCLSGSDPVVVEYAAGDGITTLELHSAQQAAIEKQNLQTVYELESKLIRVLFQAERHGLRVPDSALQRVEAQVLEEIERAKSKLPEGFNPRSSKDVKAFVSQFRCDWPTTPSGNPSFPEKWLREFPEGRLLVDLRKWQNLLNSFVTPLKTEHVWNGRVHATFNQCKMDDHGTVSGRLSMSRPNLQQVPKHDKERARLLRGLFAPTEGRLLYEADYSQCEPRLFAHYSQDPRLLDGYNSNPPKDVHTIVAELFHADRDTIAKRMNMGIFTGMFPKSFAKHLGVSLEEATRMWNRWFELFPNVRDFQATAKNVLLTRGHVRTLLGRRGRLESARLAYRAVSKIIQGGNADIIKYKMLEVAQMIERDRLPAALLLSVHDSLVWEADDTPDGKEASAKIVRVMEDVQRPPFSLRVPFVVDCSAGKTWAEATFGK